MGIATLPAELVFDICSYLDLSEWIALRLTCSALHKKTLDVFAENFKLVRFIATSDGLGELEALSRMVAVADHLRHLWMIPTVFEGQHQLSRHQFSSSDWAVSSNSCIKIEGEELDARYATYQSIVADHLGLVHSELTTRLARCCRRFKNLTTVGHLHCPTPFLLDPRQDGFRCLGYRSLKNQIDFRYGRYFPSQVSSPLAGEINSLVLSRLLQAVVESDCHIKNFSTCGPECSRTSLNLSLTPGQYESVLSVLDNLIDFHICISYDEVTDRQPNSRTTVDLLLAVAPKLEVLDLSHNLDGLEVRDRHYFQELTQRVEFTQLRELHLHSIRVTPNDLRLFLSKTKATLRDLNLTFVILDNDLPVSSSDQALFLGECADKIWRQVWDMVCEDLSLEKFSMSEIGYCKRIMNWVVPGASRKATTHAAYDSRISAISLREWFGSLDLRLMRNPNHPQPGFYDLFKYMIPAAGPDSEPCTCDLEVTRDNSCPYGYFREWWMLPGTVIVSDRQG